MNRLQQFSMEFVILLHFLIYMQRFSSFLLIIISYPIVPLQSRGPGRVWSILASSAIVIVREWMSRSIQEDIHGYGPPNDDQFFVQAFTRLRSFLIAWNLYRSLNETGVLLIHYGLSRELDLLFGLWRPKNLRSYSLTPLANFSDCWKWMFLLLPELVRTWLYSFDIRSSEGTKCPCSPAWTLLIHVCI